MSERKYLYEFDYACGHCRFETLDQQLSRAEYYEREAGKCPKCKAAADANKEAAERNKSVLLPPPVESCQRWEQRRRACPHCGEMRVLIDTAQGVMCRECRRARGLLDGKQGICDACGKRLILHFTGAAMVCRHCWEKATGKAAPADWARPGMKKGATRKARAGK